jgi:hypothetical protein
VSRPAKASVLDVTDRGVPRRRFVALGDRRDESVVIFDEELVVLGFVELVIDGA